MATFPAAIFVEIEAEDADEAQTKLDLAQAAAGALVDTEAQGNMLGG